MHLGKVSLSDEAICWCDAQDLLPRYIFVVDGVDVLVMLSDEDCYCEDYCDDYYCEDYCEDYSVKIIIVKIIITKTIIVKIIIGEVREEYLYYWVCDTWGGRTIDGATTDGSSASIDSIHHFCGKK